MKQPLQWCEGCGKAVVIQKPDGYWFSTTIAGLRWGQGYCYGKCCSCGTTYKYAYNLTTLANTANMTVTQP